MALKLIKPERLRAGDAVGIVVPASPPPDPGAIDRSLEALRRLGFEPRLSRNARNRRGYLAGSDSERAADLLRMFRDPEVKAIFCLRGGYGTARILSQLDYKTIREHPKILVGYSDITALHCALLEHAGLLTFHGPMLNSELSNPELPDFTLDSLLRAITVAEPAGSVRQGCPEHQVRTIRGGKAYGRLAGGNLSLICTTIGTPWEVRLRGRIFFFEDIEEPPYRIDRMLTHLLNAGLLQQASGIAVGTHRNCLDPKAAGTREYRQTLDEVLEERLKPLKVPVVTGLPFGHVRLNATLPVGARACLDATRGDLVIEEAAVR